MAFSRTLVAPFILFLVFRNRYGIGAGQPAVQIDIGAAARAKRPQCFYGELAANWTKMARRFRHRRNMGRRRHTANFMGSEPTAPTPAAPKRGIESDQTALHSV